MSSFVHACSCNQCMTGQAKLPFMLFITCYFSAPLWQHFPTLWFNFWPTWDFSMLHFHRFWPYSVAPCLHSWKGTLDSHPSSLIYIPCILQLVATKNIFPGSKALWGSVQPIPCILQHSTLAYALSDPGLIYFWQRQTTIRSLALPEGMHGPLHHWSL